MMIRDRYFDRYKAEIDQVEKQEWYDLLGQFGDATIYQTWAYASVRWGEKKLSHLVLKRKTKVVAIAQVVIRELPLFKIGVAYVPWGPLWHARRHGADIEALQNMLRAIRYFYGKEKKLLIRLMPPEVAGVDQSIVAVYRNEGFTRTSSQPYRTFIIDLKPSLEEIRKQFKAKWRNCLNKAQKKELFVVEGASDADYRIFLSLQKDMMSIKKFSPGVDYDEFGLIQSTLRNDFKMRIFTCLFKGVPVASLVGSVIGDRGIYLLGASNDTGRRVCASYLLQWKMIEKLKKKGTRYYDLGGIDPSTNPGVFHFKAGLKGRDVVHIGYFEACDNPMSRVSVDFLEYKKSFFQQYRENFRSISAKRR